LKLTLVQAQVRPKKHDYAHNLGLIGQTFEQLASQPAEVLFFPETFLSGYFLEGGVGEEARPREQVFSDLQAEYAKRTGGQRRLEVGVGFYEEAAGEYFNSCLYAALGPQPGLLSVHRKFYLPTYGLFDEERFVSRGRRFEAFATAFGKAGILICEDAWHSVAASLLALQGAQVIHIPSASPARGFGGAEPANLMRWRRLLGSMAEEHAVFVSYTGLIGFEGGKGMTGGSKVVSPSGEFLNEAPLAEECLLRTTLDLDEVEIARSQSPLVADLQGTLGDVLLEFNRVAQEKSSGD
jgi:predicted amidohydrolase